MAVASALSKAGHEIIILNRDIKFGGLAEYGIFPLAETPWRAQETVLGILQQKNVHYLECPSGMEGPHGRRCARAGCERGCFTIGAQGTKAIGVEGTRLRACFTQKCGLSLQSPTGLRRPSI